MRAGLRAGTSGLATAPAASTMVDSSPRIMPAPASASMSMIDQRAVHSAKTAKATPNWPGSSPAILRPGMLRPRTIRTAPMTPERNMLIKRPRESQAFARSKREQSTPAGQSTLVRLRNEAMNSTTAAPITTPSPRVRERMFT
jgi:hypothetical protein